MSRAEDFFPEQIELRFRLESKLAINKTLKADRQTLAGENYGWFERLSQTLRAGSSLLTHRLDSGSCKLKP